MGREEGEEYASRRGGQAAAELRRFQGIDGNLHGACSERSAFFRSAAHRSSVAAVFVVSSCCQREGVRFVLFLLAPRSWPHPLPNGRGSCKHGNRHATIKRGSPPSPAGPFTFAIGIGHLHLNLCIYVDIQCVLQ